MPKPPRTITLFATEGETVEVRWVCLDGQTHIERYTAPPKAVRDARRLDREDHGALRKAMGGMKL